MKLELIGKNIKNLLKLIKNLENKSNCNIREKNIQTKTIKKPKQILTAGTVQKLLPGIMQKLSLTKTS